MRTSHLKILAVLAIALTPAVVLAGPYQDGHCQLTAPNDWVASKTRIARPDKKVWASLLEAGSASEIVALETGLKAVKVSEDARVILMVSTASGSGMTNKQYHAITKTTPSCLADVAAPAGPEEALAKQVAMTVSLKK